jgi:glycosyltransferase involved in cell wall biosynthesis
MRILYYNWVDFLDTDKRGGGVTIYQKNLVDELSNKGHDVFFLSSGMAYNLKQRPYVRENESYKGVRRFELVNSEVLSPGHISFYSESSLYAEKTRNAFFEFIEDVGPFDVIHFNNLEGIPVEVLSINEKWKKTKVVFSLHNYYAVCPQVNLWHREKENCLDYNGGSKCATCLDYEPNATGSFKAKLLAELLNGIGINQGSKFFSLSFMCAPKFYSFLKGIKSLPEKLSLLIGQSNDDKSSQILDQIVVPEDIHYLLSRRQVMIRHINKYCDVILSVSNRVKEVASSFGIMEEKIRTLYIGTKIGDLYSPPNINELLKELSNKKTICIGYLGYMRKDKGFYFLMDTLESFPNELARKINLVIAARLSDPVIKKRLEILAGRFNEVHYSNGYTHDTLPEIYKKLDLSIVPVLWEDNLPQVVYESACHHVPVLTSNLGGAKEVGGCNSDFIFEAGSENDFINKVSYFSENPERLAEYWKGVMRPPTMSAHVSDLVRYYQE